MLGVGWFELALVALVALLVLGPAQLKTVARQAGKSWQVVKRWRDDLARALDE
jgi:Sec-independent protein translocase protein TatA